MARVETICLALLALVLCLPAVRAGCCCGCCCPCPCCCTKPIVIKLPPPPTKIVPCCCGCCCCKPCCCCSPCCCPCCGCGGRRKRNALGTAEGGPLSRLLTPTCHSAMCTQCQQPQLQQRSCRSISCDSPAQKSHKSRPKGLVGRHRRALFGLLDEPQRKEIVVRQQTVVKEVLRI